MIQNPKQGSNFITDKDIAKRLGLTVSWVKKQRYLRKKAEPHQLNIDPIYIGNQPRYRLEDFQEWTSSI